MPGSTLFSWISMLFEFSQRPMRSLPNKIKTGKKLARVFFFLGKLILCPRLGAEWIGRISWLPRAPLGPIFMTSLWYSVQSIVPTIVLVDLSYKSVPKAPWAAMRSSQFTPLQASDRVIIGLVCIIRKVQKITRVMTSISRFCLLFYPSRLISNSILW